MGALATLGAVAFDPTIRGILVVVVGTTVLMGSIFMILMTNSGVRVGFLLAISGFFGWMFLMGIIWVVYGIGLKGRDPAWMPTDVLYTRDEPVRAVPELDELPSHEALPNAEKLLEEHPLVHSLALASEGSDYQPSTLTKLKTVIQPWVTVSRSDLMPLARTAESTAPELFAENAEAAEAFAAGDGTKFRDLVRADAEELREKIESPTGGWCLLTESDTRRGEAQAAADAALIAEKTFGDPTETSDYIVQDVFFYGGKEPCDPISEKSSLQQAWHRVATAFEVKNPKLLAAVTVVKTKDQPTIEGQAPPPATPEPGAESVTVSMLRNLGNKRFIPFMFTLANLIGFVIFTTMLHYRDREAMAVRAAFSGAGKG